eukprot:10482327-Ditylum_brightwellii.AAC.1
MKIDVWAAPEMKLAWMHLIQEAVQNQGKNTFGAFKVIGTSSLEGTIGTQQSGGICLLAQGDMIGRIALAGTDSQGLGRWSYAVFNRCYNKQTWVIAAYRVLQQNSAGTLIACSQQERLLKLQEIQNPKPKQ